MKRWIVLLALVCLAVPSWAAEKRRLITFDDLISMERIASPAVSPDGKWVAFTVTKYDKAANTRSRNLWLVPTSGGALRQLTTSAKTDDHPSWSPDGKHIAFISDRDGSAQIWVIAVDGGEARQISHISTEASGVMWSPDGRWLAFASEVFAECRDDACNKRKLEEREKSKVKARLIDHLMYRHWDHWLDGKRSHLFVVAATGGEPRDLTPGVDYDVPTWRLQAPDDYSFSPDGKEICYSAKTDPNEAISTNSDLFLVPVAGGPSERITTNRGDDATPRYSPDGRWIAYRAQMQPGYESDRWRLMVYDRATHKSADLTPEFDSWVEEFTWSPDSKRLYFWAEDKSYRPIYSVPVAGGKVETLIGQSFNSDAQPTADGKSVIFVRQSDLLPAEIFRANADGTDVRSLTEFHRDILARVDLNPAEDIWYEGAEKVRVHAMLLKPPGFDPSKKYPLVVLVHGGPQGAWTHNWGYRWNPHMFAAPGYVILMPNPRGSTGFGQKLIDDINRDWGGKVYEDILKGVEYVTANYAFVDKTRMCAAGGSYGGYMTNWLEGHTDIFRCLISHAGPFNKVSMYGTTEELWFEEWNMGGTPWTNRETYERWSPVNFVKNFKTPMLVIQGGRDFRVPESEAFQTFTALQRMGVPSRFLYFPDEGHWILKAQNSELWYKTVQEWLAKYLK